MISMANSFRTSTATKERTRDREWPKGPTGQPLGATKAEVLAFFRYMNASRENGSKFEIVDGVPRLVDMDVDKFFKFVNRGGPTREELLSSLEQILARTKSSLDRMDEVLSGAREFWFEQTPTSPLVVIFKNKRDIVTHCDFDGLVSAALYRNHENASDSIIFTVPGDIQHNILKVNGNHAVLDLPWAEKCGFYADHHSTNKPPENAKFEGMYMVAPSAARVLTVYYEDSASYYLRSLVDSTDRIDSNKLTVNDFINPEGYVKVSVTVRFWANDDIDYKRMLIDLLRFQNPDQILKHPEAAARFKKQMEEYNKFRDAIRTMAKVHGRVLFIDFRTAANPPTGPNALIEDSYPNSEIIMRVRNTPGGVNIIASHNSLNCENAPDVGKIMANYGGGGHSWGAGTTIPAEKADRAIKEIITTLNG